MLKSILPYAVILLTVLGLVCYASNIAKDAEHEGDVIIPMCGPIARAEPGERRFGIYNRDLVADWNREQHEWERYRLKQVPNGDSP